MVYMRSTQIQLIPEQQQVQQRNPVKTKKKIISKKQSGGIPATGGPELWASDDMQTDRHIKFGSKMSNALEDVG